LYDQFSGKTTEELKFFLGAIIEPKKYYIEQVFNGDETTIPVSFNWASTTAPYGGNCVGAVRSQLNCGSCWAFSSTSALADRLCVQSQGQVAGVVLSPEHLVMCDTLDGCGGCNGGSLNGAWF